MSPSAARPLRHDRTSKARLARLLDVCTALPEVEVSGEAHRTFRVRKKTFAYYLFDHHGDGLIALTCKAPPGEQERLVRMDPKRYFVPSYLGPRGWAALRLDLPSVDWGEVVELLTAYRLTAPRKLVARIE